LPARRISTGRAAFPILVHFKPSPVGNWGQGAGMVHFRMRAVRVVENRGSTTGAAGWLYVKRWVSRRLILHQFRAPSFRLLSGEMAGSDNRTNAPCLILSPGAPCPAFGTWDTSGLNAVIGSRLSRRDKSKLAPAAVRRADLSSRGDESTIAHGWSPKDGTLGKASHSSQRPVGPLETLPRCRNVRRGASPAPRTATLAQCRI